MSSLADRIRGIVKPTSFVGATSHVGVAPAIQGDHTGPSLHDRDLPATLGGAWHQIDGRSCFIVERRWESSTRHGRDAVGDVAVRLQAGSEDAALFAGGAPARPPFVFFDLETTGLSGGAGTYAFLVGCGRFESDGSFVTRQFVMTRYADERPLLEAVAGELAGAGALVSFNGKSFDAPVFETRYLFHRLEWIAAELPHIDALHPARRFWGASGPKTVGRRDAIAAEASGRGPSTECSLIALERRLMGTRRVNDVPGFEIPARYFQFVRSGDPRPLVAVLEHNRLDLLTLASLTARLLHLARSGPTAAHNAREAYGLGTTYARAGLDARARDCFARAVDLCRAPPGAFDPLRIESLRALALAWRRARQWDEAAACWRRLLDTRSCPTPVRREAAEALAIHHEHRVHDLAAAQAFALRTLEPGVPPRWIEAAQHRLARIDRKMQIRSLTFEV